MAWVRSHGWHQGPTRTRRWHQRRSDRPGHQPNDNARLEVLETEPAGVAHLRPDPRLGHGEELPDVIAIVMDPLAEQLVDAQRAHLRVDADTTHVGRTERPYERHAVKPKSPNLGRQLDARAQIVAPRLGDGRRIPTFEVRRDVWTVGGQDPANPAGESASLRLDEVADTFVGAPLAGLGSPSAVRPERLELGDDGRRRGHQKIGDLRGRNDAGGRVGHETPSPDRAALVAPG